MTEKDVIEEWEEDGVTAGPRTRQGKDQDGGEEPEPPRDDPPKGKPKDEDKKSKKSKKKKKDKKKSKKSKKKKKEKKQEEGVLLSLWHRFTGLFKKKNSKRRK